MISYQCGCGRIRYADGPCTHCGRPLPSPVVPAPREPTIKERKQSRRKDK